MPMETTENFDNIFSSRLRELEILVRDERRRLQQDSGGTSPHRPGESTKASGIQSKNGTSDGVESAFSLSQSLAPVTHHSATKYPREAHEDGDDMAATADDVSRKTTLVPNLWNEWRSSHFDPQNSTDLARQFEFLPSIRKFDWKAWMVVSTTGSDQEARHEDPGGAHCILRPGSQIRMAWEAIGMLFLTYDLVWIPVCIAFNTPEPIIITVCEIATLLYWCMDIAVHFKLAYFTPQGNLEVRPRQIALRYLRRWFFFDLLLVLVEVFFLVTGRLDVENSGDTASSLVRLLRHSRLLRMARLLRLRKFRRLIFWVQDYVTSEWWSAVLSASQNVYTLLAINHFIACIWFGIAKYENRHGRENWVFAYEFELNSFVLQYFVALHWSMCFFTPASMNVQPQSLLERIFAVLVLLFAMVVFSSFVSSITSAMTRIQNSRSHEIHQSLMLRRFLKENHVSNSLSSRVTKEIEFILECQKKKVHRTKVELLSLLSGPLNVELQRELHKPHLVDHPFFETYEKVSEPAMTQLCFTALNVVHFLKGDAVFRVDTKAKNMYFLTDGSLYYKRMKGIQGVRPAVKINRGQWFCEMVLWMPWTHRGTMRSLFDCETIALDSEAFRRVTLSHEPSFLYSQRYAIEYYEGLKATYERRLHVWDVPDEVMYADASTKNLAKEFEFARLESKFGRRRSGTISLGVQEMLADSSDSDGPDSSHVCI